MPFLDENSLELDVQYTVTAIQHLYASSIYFYVIRFREDTSNTDYYMNVNSGNLYDKLEQVRNSTQKNQFTFTKQLVNIYQDVSAPFVIIDGDNDVVELSS